MCRCRADGRYSWWTMLVGLGPDRRPPARYAIRRVARGDRGRRSAVLVRFHGERLSASRRSTRRTAGSCGRSRWTAPASGARRRRASGRGRRPAASRCATACSSCRARRRSTRVERVRRRRRAARGQVDESRVGQRASRLDTDDDVARSLAVASFDAPPARAAAFDGDGGVERWSADAGLAGDARR